LTYRWGSFDVSAVNGRRNAQIYKKAIDRCYLNGNEPLDSKSSIGFVNNLKMISVNEPDLISVKMN